MKYAMINNEQLRQAIEKGLHYYKTVQFFDNGQSLWRIPKIYPVDIHNQAQGIITFSLLKEFNKEYFAFAGKIVEWTIKNMQDKHGYFIIENLNIISIKFLICDGLKHGCFSL